jgi:hypothetical protein
MALIKTLPKEVEVRVGDKVRVHLNFIGWICPLYVCYIDGDNLYLSGRMDSSKEECDRVCVGNCYLI